MTQVLLQKVALLMLLAAYVVSDLQPPSHLRQRSVARKLNANDKVSLPHYWLSKSTIMYVRQSAENKNTYEVNCVDIHSGKKSRLPSITKTPYPKHLQISPDQKYALFLSENVERTSTSWRLVALDGSSEFSYHNASPDTTQENPVAVWMPNSKQWVELSGQSKHQRLRIYSLANRKPIKEIPLDFLENAAFILGMTPHNEILLSEDIQLQSKEAWKEQFHLLKLDAHHVNDHPLSFSSDTEPAATPRLSPNGKFLIWAFYETPEGLDKREILYDTSADTPGSSVEDEGWVAFYLSKPDGSKRQRLGYLQLHSMYTEYILRTIWSPDSQYVSVGCNGFIYYISIPAR